MLQLVGKNKMAFDKERWRVFGDWLKEKREKSKLSQEGLGDLAGLDRQQIYRLENALSGTKRETVIALANALKVSEDEALQKAGFAAQNGSSVPKPILEAIGSEGVLSDNDTVLVANFIKMLKQNGNKKDE